MELPQAFQRWFGGSTQTTANTANADDDTSGGIIFVVALKCRSRITSS
jgi:hypothetical protein